MEIKINESEVLVYKTETQGIKYEQGTGETYGEAEANTKPFGETEIDGLHSILLILVIALIAALVFISTNKKE